MPAHYTAEQAATRLGISKKSLYAYVSRGLVRATSAGGRRKHYNADDVDGLWRAQQERHNPEHVARHTLDWHGHPVMPSALSTVGPHTLCYRGKPIEALVEELSMSLEQIAALLWHGEDTTAVSFAHALPPGIQSLPRWPDLTPLKRTQIFWSMAEHEDFGAYRLDAPSVARTGEHLMSLMLEAIAQAGVTRESPPTHSSAAARFAHALDISPHTHLIDMAMILCAEHGLNASTFAARVTASTRASPYGVCQSGLAALLGQRHAGTTLRIGAWIDEVMRARSLHHGVLMRLRRGETWPGLGHKLYPGGDPRAAILWRHIQRLEPASSWQPYAELLDALHAIPDLGAPSIDLMLVVLMRVLGGSDEDALTLFAAGRCIGWIAHAMEQYDRDEIIRPRAHYAPDS